MEVFPSQSGRYPIAVLCIDVPPSDVDVNLESDKSRVALHNLVRNRGRKKRREKKMRGLVGTRGGKERKN